MAAKRIETAAQLRRAIARLSPASAFTDRFSATWRSSRGAGSANQQERKDVWYETQHEHWLGWLKGYDGPGAYGRVDHSRSAEFIYNHIVNPQMLIYLAEATKVAPALLKAAAKSALANRATMGSMSAAIRQVISWNTVEEALLSQG